MRARQWKGLAMATIAAMALAGCGGDAGDDLPEEAQLPEENQGSGLPLTGRL